MIMGPISLIFCGHLGDKIELDGAALAMSMMNATCMAIGQGLGTACDTFFSQTYGSKNKKQVGVYAQRALYIFLLALLPCFAIHLNMENFLKAVGQNPDVSRLAGTYILIFMPGALAFFVYVILSKYLQNQNIVFPNVVIGAVANAVNAVLHYVLLFRLDFGIYASAMCQAVSYSLLCVLTLGYILATGCHRDTWGGWTTEALQDWGKFYRICIPGMLMLCMEWWGFEIGVFVTGLLGTTELGAQSVLLQIDSIWFQVPLGIQIACAIRVGQSLGSGNTAAAKTSARLAIVAVLIASVGAIVLFMSLQRKLPYLFTNVRDVAELTGDLLPIVTIYVFFDATATACKGSLYGTGRQIYGAVLLFLSYYVLALPLGIPLMFYTPLRSAGYWWALAGNLILQSVVLVTIVLRTNWTLQMEKAQERAGVMGEIVQDSATESTEDERISLLTDRPTEKAPPGGRKRLVSVTLSMTAVHAVMHESTELTTGALYCRRLLVVLAMFSIVAAGILLRIYLPVIPVEGAGIVNATAHSVNGAPP